MADQKRARGRPKSQFRESSASTLNSLDRALGLLTTLAQAERATLTDLALSAGVPTATTHRILTTLQKRGFVSFDEDRQDWMIGLEAYRTGVSYLSRNGIVEAGQVILPQLMRETAETANLAVPDGAEVVFVGQVETKNPVRAFFPPGARTPMHASGTGKAILAAMAEDQAQKLLQGAGLQRFTDNTLSTPAALFDDLALTRARGFSFDREERFAGMSCVGAAIFDENGLPCAGVSVSGPDARFDAGSVAGFGAAVARAAREITRISGGRMPG
ncbi:IclR family transcriptional regulator [Nioella sp. MMSF_3534]|uniref:IclR family transcriptional regulator n=1 Tax=Nioella sp. MMSF_3534 TaxID=3046720 RepID=UPI00273FE1AC|nr:IclR family transcriptional regulator [Nioella sp. MMSF_3534]